MITHTVLFEHMGSNSTTPHTPIGAYLEGSVDLTKIVSRCINSDFDMLCDVLLYEVHTVELPEWLSLEEWIQGRTGWTWLWACNKLPKGTPEVIQRNLLTLKGSYRHALVKLITTDLRSEFRKSLKGQAMVWLTQEPRTQKFQSPLSPKQAEMMIGPRGDREYQSLSDDLYLRLRYNLVLA